MARMIRHEKNSPYEVAEGTELPIYICACGLSKNKPFCDGSHKKTRDENPTDVYSTTTPAAPASKLNTSFSCLRSLLRLFPFPRGKGLGWLGFCVSPRTLAASLEPL